MRYALPFIAMLAATTAPVAAQEPADSAAPVAPSPPVVRVVSVHSEETLRRALDDARMDKRDAEATLRRATEEREQAKARIEVKKHEIATIDARRKLADKEKHESAKAALKVERREAEAEKKLAERLDEVYESEIELAKKTRDLAEADEKLAEVELELVARRRERERLPPTDAVAVQRLDQVVIALERKVLEARRDHAAVAKDVAEREEKIAERRIDLFEANLAASGMSER